MSSPARDAVAEVLARHYYGRPEGDVPRERFEGLAEAIVAVARPTIKAAVLREFADRFRPGDGNPWALHVRAQARAQADRILDGTP